MNLLYVHDDVVYWRSPEARALNSTYQTESPNTSSRRSSLEALENTKSRQYNWHEPNVRVKQALLIGAQGSIHQKRLNRIIKIVL